MAGVERWFKLEPRSSASRVEGDCHLVLKLITTQVGKVGVSVLHPCPRGWGGAGDPGGSALQRDTAMSQRGRSGFLSHLLLLSHLLRFEHPAEEVVGAPGIGTARQGA